MTAPLEPYRVPEIISRKEAMVRGLKRYFTGKPCRRGHVAERLSSTRDCVGCYSFVCESSAAKKSKEKWRLINRPPIQRRQKTEPERKTGIWRKTKWRKKFPQKDREYSARKYYEGPSNPTGEKQWLRKNQAQLRSLRRELRNRNRQDCDQPQS